MIPSQRPPFGIGRATRAILKGSRKNSLEEVERAYASGCDVEEAIWVPSGRVGIYWALKASLGRDEKIVGPAYTCGVVHEAMFRSPGKMHLVDAGAGSYLMDEDLLAAAQTEPHVLVLSEIYGHNYDLAKVLESAPVDRMSVV